MADPSNPTSRVMNVLKFLAEYPTETFSLAEIAKHVGLTNGSAHRLLTTMADGQFLTRNEKHRTYSLGVALVGIGQAAIEKHRGIEIAKREIARLAVEMNAQCSVNTVIDGEIVVLAKEGMAQSPAGLTRVGERRPLMPPVGLCHIAWESETAVQAYIDRAVPHLNAQVRNQLLNALPIIRSRGYSITANGTSSWKIRKAIINPEERTQDEEYWTHKSDSVDRHLLDEVQLLDLNQAKAQGVNYIAAPVFSPAAKVAFALVISGLPSGLNAREIEAYAEKLCATAAVITTETHGRQPITDELSQDR